MALWDNERRILGEIEEQLSRDDPGFARKMTSFEAQDPPSARSTAWKPWLVVGLVVTLILGLLGVLVSVSMSDSEGAEAAPVLEPLPTVASLDTG